MINRGIFYDVKRLDNLYKQGWHLKLDKNMINKFKSPHTDRGFYLEREGKVKFLR